MTPAVHSAPRLSAHEAVRLARELYGIEAAAEPLPSERDQNFLLCDRAGARFVLKIANAREERRMLDLQNRALAFLAEQDTGLEWPRLLPSTSGAEIAQQEGHMVRLLTWVEGRCLALVQPHRPPLLASIGQTLAKVDNALDGFSHPAAHRDFYWDLRCASIARQHLP